MSINALLYQLERYKRGAINFSEEELKQMDSSYTFLEFTGEPEKIYHESSEAIKKGLPIKGDTIYILLLVNDNDRLDKVMQTIPMNEIRSLSLNEKYGIYTSPPSEDILQTTLLLIFK